MNWKTSAEDSRLIGKIVSRAMTSGLARGDALDLNMDITAVHGNDTKLDLQRLLDAPQFDFTHDVCGLQAHIDRRTGKLKDFFCPRTAARAERSVL